MSEELGTIIHRGFDTWKHNINLALPFILDPLVSLLVAGVVGMAVILAIGIDTFLKLLEQAQPILESLENAQQPPVLEAAALLSLIKPYLAHIILAVIVILIATGIIRAFFRAGAIGMAKMALEKGSTSLADLVEHAKKHTVNLLLTDILIALLLLAGIVFLLPAALLSPEPFNLAEAHIGLLMLGLVLWILYMLAVGILFMLAPYALVIESLHPLDALKKSAGFFMAHKLDVILLLLLSIAVSIGASILLGSIPFIGGILNTLAAMVIIQPLTLLWWTRLYMAKNKQKTLRQRTAAAPQRPSKNTLNKN